MKYRELNIHQRIGLKGIIQNPRTRPQWFDNKTHNYFDGLKALWYLDGFVAAVEMFLNGFTQNK